MILNAQNVSYSYASRQVLNDVAMQLTPGVTALVGVNGAGKTTLMEVLAGTRRPKTGSVSVNDLNVYDGKGRSRALQKISLMPQAPRFPNGMTAMEIVSYLAWLKGVPRRLVATRASDALSLVGLEERGASKFGALSGGMQRRVAFAQAIASRPDFLLLDEPTTGLDPQQRVAMANLVRETQSVVLMSSHVAEDVADLAKRIIVLHQGAIRFDGETRRLAERGQGSALGRTPLESAILELTGDTEPS